MTYPLMDAIAFEQPERAQRLWARWQGDSMQAELFERFAPMLADALQHAPDPDRLLVNLDRWLESLGATLTYYRLFAETPDALKPTLAILAHSQYMTDALLQNPELSEILLDARLLHRPRPRTALRRDLNRYLKPCATYWMKLDRLRAFKQQEFLRLTALDLLGKASLPEVARGLSDLADVCADAALEICHQELSAQMGVTGEHGVCILAMGKWGGRELNYSSDIDPILLCADETNLHHTPDPMRYRTRLAELWVKTLSEPMRRGIVFRVDLRLRPEGRFGPLVRTLSAAEHYYENWAEPWERQAMLKARACAGDTRVGEAFLERIAPWVYRPALSDADFEQIVQQRIRSEAQCQARGTLETDLKNGWGGVRDIEFPTQALQLMFGGKHPRLRTPNTLDALQRLQNARLLTPSESHALRQAYCFLRTAEHRLQILHGQQTHTLPSSPAERTRFARHMGYANLDAFEADLQKHRRVARQYRERVLAGGEAFPSSAYRSTQGTGTSTPGAETPAWRELSSLIGAPEGESAWRLCLESLGFSESARAYSVLLANTVGAAYGAPPPDARKAFEVILPELLVACARTPNPDRALMGLERLADAFPSRAALFASYAESPEVLTRLAELAQSPPLWNRLLSHLELLDMLFGAEIVARGAKTRMEHAHALSQRLQGCRTVQARVNNLSAYARREWLRIGARDLWSETTPEQTARDLTALAEILMTTLWEIVAPETPMLIVGYGSLGAGELGYGSDWDIAFVCADDADGDATQAAAQAFLSHCQQLTEQGAFRPVDMRLRPEGGAGALVRTLSGWRSYFRQSAAPWERLAALRARPLNPNSPLAEPFLLVLNEFRYDAPPTPDALAEMQRLAQRALTERTPPQQLNTHLKLGRAGQATIEFLVHWLVVQHATPENHPQALPTIAQLEWLWRNGVLERADHDALREAWLFVYHLRNRLHLLFEPAPETLPEDERLHTLAQSLNLSCAEQLHSLLQEHRGMVGQIARRFKFLS
ncbi:MAG: glutamate-ammonia-ligase adenylyltransferase [Fimbriimonadales bacterium]|nr:MAG: glutamate-ammonia-ligase adenylyltransferase [Fimbriimonadales bacterium]